MSTSLRDFLKQKATVYAAQNEKNREVIEEWQEAVGRLFSTLEEWLRAADPDGFIQHERSQIEITEPSLGRYRIDRMNLQAFGRWVGVIPKARKTVKTASPQQSGDSERATGRVDLTDEIRRFALYRFGQREDARWFIDDPATNSALQPLTPDRFESALLGYFQ